MRAQLGQAMTLGPRCRRSKGREDLVGHRYLLDRVLRERDADGVPYAVGQKLSERGRLMAPGSLVPASVTPRWSGASSACELPVGLDHLGYVARLERDLEVQEPHLLGYLHFMERAGNERFRFGEIPEALLDGAELTLFAWRSLYPGTSLYNGP